MALWSSLIDLPRVTPSRPRPSRARLTLQSLEDRNVLTVGGGSTAGGLLGEYFANPDLAGVPAFTRRDVRVDFDWQGRTPGGSTSPDFASVAATDFSVRWTGQVLPQFSESYTFHATSNNGLRLYIRPTGSVAAWTVLVDDWGAQAAGDHTATYLMAAGRSYDIRLEYHDLEDPASVQLAWSSPNTPEVVIDPAADLGVNAVTYDKQVYADAAKTGRLGWGDPVDYFGRPAVATDALGWPTADAGHLFWDGQDPAKTGGMYLLQFSGQAEVSGWMGRGDFIVDGTHYGSTLPLDIGYDPTTNTTTAEVSLGGTDLFGINFVHTQRDGTGAVDSGITDVQFMRPVAVNGSTPNQPGELFSVDIKNAFSRFTTLRYLTANFNAETDWSDRMLPGDMQAAWGDQHAVWENEVMLANETGKDLYITVPVKATEDYITNLANLIRYGSDGVNPYTKIVSNPVYPGLNPNLRVYVEWGNEIWNWAFAQGGWAADAGRAAVLAGTPDGQIVNFDGLRPGGDFRRWAALKTVQTSNSFRSVWGNPAMGDHVRVVLEYQYDNQQLTATESLKFVDQYFNNGDGKQHVPDPHPVRYYIWGAGGAAYFGSSNPRGLVSNIRIPGGTFDGVYVGASGTAVADPTGTSWGFSGDAGVYRNRTGAAANAAMSVPGVGPVPATPQGTQAMYVSGTGSTWVTVTFPQAGIYALDFQAASEFGPGMGNPLDFYLNDQRITPNGSDLTPPPYPWWPGNGNRDSGKFSPYGTVPVQIPGPGRYTFKIVGRGTAAQTTVIDDVQVESLDALFASRLPAGGRSAGEQSTADYQTQLAVQASFAQTYGLNVVSYEGGWSLGGDSGAVPLESWAKYLDPRSATVMGNAIDAFYRAGGELYIVGTYDQWHLDDAAHASGYPLVRGIDSRLSRLTAAPASGIRIPGSAPVTLRSVSGLNGLSLPAFAAPGDWFSWNILIPTTGNYNLTSNTGSNGTVGLNVDGIEVGRGSSVAPVSSVVRLTAGIHTIRVQSVGGWFMINGVTLDRLDL
jgi:PA14 domain